MSDLSRILVTGATGFVGSALVARVARDGHYTPVPAGRSKPAACGSLEWRFHDLESVEGLPSLAGIDTIIHAAARVHVMHQEDPSAALAAFRRSNVDGTLALARHAAASGVRRLVFVSSIKVNGEGTLPGRPFTADALPAPLDAYGISKHEAEQGLLALANSTGLEVVIVRPPLVYGPGVKANFEKMLQGLAGGWPLPLGAIHNRRSLVAIENLIDLLLTCVAHPRASGRVFLVSDDHDLSTTELLRTLAAGLGVSARLLPVPSDWLQRAASVLGRSAITDRLCGSLQVDISATRRHLEWEPPLSAIEALHRTARGFRAL